MMLGLVLALTGVMSSEPDWNRPWEKPATPLVIYDTGSKTPAPSPSPSPKGKKRVSGKR